MDLRKLDALVSVKVMGRGPARFIKHGGSKDWFVYNDTGITVIPMYSKFMGAAWDVGEKVDMFEGSVLQKENGLWQVGYYVGGNDNYFELEIEAQTAPLAICLAALKAKSIDVGEWEK